VPSGATISATVSDQTGGTTNSVPIQINNLPPVFQNVAINSPIFPNDPMTLSGTFSDIGSQDTEVLEINWGDGSPLETRLYPLPAGAFTLQHTYTAANTNFPIILALRDNDGGTSTLTTNISVVLPASPL